MKAEAMRLQHRKRYKRLIYRSGTAAAAYKYQTFKMVYLPKNIKWHAEKQAKHQAEMSLLSTLPRYTDSIDRMPVINVYVGTEAIENAVEASRSSVLLAYRASPILWSDHRQRPT